MLITEAVRGEGGRLFTLCDGKPYYFMEEAYPERGNLMPRDVIAREEWKRMQQGQKIFLDMRHLDKAVQQFKLQGVVEDCCQFLSLDPTKEPIPIEPGIHYFMGGIWVDRQHRTNCDGLYAAGECACQYHGANRLGGNSLLGALYGGRTAARSAMADGLAVPSGAKPQLNNSSVPMIEGGYVDGILEMRRILKNGLGIVRDANSLQDALSTLTNLCERVSGGYDPSASAYENELLQNGCLLGRALLMSADNRKESRGAHIRSDFSEERREYQKQTLAQRMDNEIRITLESVGEENAH